MHLQQTVAFLQGDGKFPISVLMQSTSENADCCVKCESAFTRLPIVGARWSGAVWQRQHRIVKDPVPILAGDNSKQHLEETVKKGMRLYTQQKLTLIWNYIFSLVQLLIYLNQAKLCLAFSR